MKSAAKGTSGESQFESYRALGYHVGLAALDENLEELGQWRPEAGP